MKVKNILVCGAGGFIGYNLSKRLVEQGHNVVGVDIKLPSFGPIVGEVFIEGDLTKEHCIQQVFSPYRDFDEVYQLAADMGGALYIFSGKHDANVMHNSALVNLNIAEACVKYKVGKVFYSSSACIYPEHNQMNPENPICSESSAYPADPDSEYGWEKLFSERLYMAFARNYGLNVRIARFHNIYGPNGTYEGGKEKAPAAMLRKAILAQDGGSIDVLGDGKQTRSFLYIDACLDAVQKLMESEFQGPVNIGSEEMVTINQLAEIAIELSGKKLSINNIDSGMTGVRGRCSDNRLINAMIGYNPEFPLRIGMMHTYNWIKQQIENGKP